MAVHSSHLLLHALLLYAVGLVGCRSQERGSFQPAEDRQPVPSIAGGSTVPFAKCASPTAQGDCVRYGPSVLEVVIRPELYDGRAVELMGYYSDDFEDTFLYPTAETYDHLEHPSALKVRLDAADKDKYHRFHGERVRLEATISRGVVTKIERMDVADFRRSTFKMPPPPPPPGVPWPKDRGKPPDDVR